MNIFVIGDLQGCAKKLDELLSKIKKISNDAKYFFIGDFVNRGPESLKTLLRIKSLEHRSNFVLGNHDLHLLAVAAGVRDLKKTDTFKEVLDYSKSDEIISWLRKKPLAVQINKYLFIHAGVLPQWTTKKVLELSKEVENELQGENWKKLLKNLYDNEPKNWNEKLVGFERLRCIVNALTRIRYCDSNGDMNFLIKGDLSFENESLIPWFNFPNRKTKDITVVFGHWSSAGLILKNNIIGIDTGCVWGKKLSAINLHNNNLVQVDCSNYL
tara:strand:+ start:931 stop:1740 length:810 start_codon:yes stop_codon:yes gene_type:complete